MKYWQIVCEDADSWSVYDGGDQVFSTDSFGGAARYVQMRAAYGDEIYVNTIVPDVVECFCGTDCGID